MIPGDVKTAPPATAGGNSGFKAWFARWMGRIWSVFSWPLVSLINRIRGVAQPILPNTEKPAVPVAPKPNEPEVPPPAKPDPMPKPENPPTLGKDDHPIDNLDDDDVDLNALFGSDDDDDSDTLNVPPKQPAEMPTHPQPAKAPDVTGISNIERLRQKRMQAQASQSPSKPVKSKKPAEPKKSKPANRPVSTPKPVKNNPVVPSTPTEPLKLSNIGSSCYLDSVLQALLCTDSIVEQLRQPLVKGNRSDAEFKKVTAIHKELLKLIDSTPIDIEETLKSLRKAIFDSGLHAELKVKIREEKDAAAAMELVLGEFLYPQKLVLQEHLTTEQFKELEFRGLNQDLMTLQISFPEASDKKIEQLLNLIHINLRKNRINDAGREFDPKRAVKPQNGDPKKVPSYVQHHRLANLPPFMVLHFKRFNSTIDGKTTKSEENVKLPKEGLIDLANYYDSPEGKATQAKYKIKSYVVHSGGLHGGHYVTYVEKNGKYFLCNDLNANCYQEITKEEFFSNTQAYLIVLEKV